MCESTIFGRRGGGPDLSPVRSEALLVKGFGKEFIVATTKVVFTR